MAKKGLDISSVTQILRDIEGSGGWSLCVGAGTSEPVIPNWFALVERLINKYCKAEDKIDIKLFREMGFSADAMIQAVKNRLKISDDEFVHILSEVIYSPIRNSISSKEWKSYIRIQNNPMLANIKQDDWDSYGKIIDKVLYKTSANLLAEVVTNSISYGMGPKAILSFNGEDIFLSLLNYYYWSKRIDNKNMFDYIINGISHRNINRIPYIHCHGVIPINGTKERKGQIASDKLVFLEESYLQLAYSPISWQAMNFINNCMHSRMVFVGVSLTDANMRRWLGWIHHNKMKEFRINGIECSDSTEHYWINKKPKMDVEKTWVEESVSHLGVRLVWIDEWSQVGEVLSKLLGIWARG